MPGVTGKLIADAVLEAHPWAHVAWLPALDDVLVWLRGVLRPGDLCLTLGAGDLTGLAPRILRPAGGPAVSPGPAAVERAAALLGDLAERDVPLGPFTTYKVGGPAALLVRAAGADDLAAVGAAVAATAGRRAGGGEGVEPARGRRRLRRGGGRAG